MQEIHKLSECLGGLEGVICDLWGVIHNGRTAFPGAIAALRGIRASGRPLILLSNSPRPSSTVKTQLLGLGVPEECFDAIITSGDLSRTALVKAGNDKSYFHLGPARDRATTEGLPNPETDDLKRADYILCTGFFEDWSMDPKSYEALLAAGVERKIPMICANPDKEVDIGDRRMLCAGSLAALYERMGGEVQLYGKPEMVAYRACLDFLQDIKGPVDPARLLAIGDNLETDIRGGAALGMTTLFIAEGLHGKHGTTKEQLEPFMKKLDIYPDMFMKRLEW